MRKEKVDKIVFGDYIGGYDSGCRIVLKKIIAI